MKKKIFAVFSWDPLVKNLYEKVLDKYKSKWDIQYGSKKICIDNEKTEIEEFVNRNKTLFNIFADGIKECDIFIADITDLNANVLIELGVAIRENKNTVILTRNELNTLPFDIKHRHIYQYKNEEDLIDIIKKNLDIFLKIKSQTFDKPINGMIYKEKGGEISSSGWGINPIKFNRPLKNVKIKIDFLIEETTNHWFGIILRCKSHPHRSSILINSRHNGNTDVTLYPGEGVVKREESFFEQHDGNSFRKLQIKLDETQLTITNLETNRNIRLTNIENQDFGQIYIAVYSAKAKYKNLQLINLDTINPK